MDLLNNNDTMSGEAAVVVAARVGQTTALKQLISSQHHPPSLAQQSAALYAAARAGQVESVKLLLDAGINVDNGEPEAPLLGALAGGHAEVAMLLIHYGADSDVKDPRGNSCLHLACSNGLYNVVRSLCALGCVQSPNTSGQYPLHVAARHGHINIVRLLCFYGCRIDQKNGDGIRADITALKYGHNHVAELLDKLRLGHVSTSSLRSQLLPGSRPISRLQVKLFGHSGAGKTSLAASLNVGLLQQFFRRSASLTTRSRPSSPSQSSHNIEMDVTHRYSSLSFDSCSTCNYVPTKGVHVQQMELSGVGDITVWEFSGQESFFQVYHHFISDVLLPQSSSIFSNRGTRGNSGGTRSSSKSSNSDIEVAKYSAANDHVVTSLAKKRGHCNYENLTECSKYFCKSSTVNAKSKQSRMTVYVVMFSLEKPFNIQVQQCVFWLNFIISRLSPCSYPGGLGHAILIGSHGDVRAHRTCNGDFVYTAGDALLQEVTSLFHHFFTVHHQVLILDCNAANSAGIKSFKNYLSTIKRNISHGCESGGQQTTVFGSEYNLISNSPAKQKHADDADNGISYRQTPVGNWSGFLEESLSWIQGIRKSIETFPVMEKRVFMDNIRSCVNLLASDEHIVDVIQNLHLIGEIMCIGESVVLCCEWLCKVLGSLLGRKGLQGVRPIGVYTAHDFQAHFGYCDASQLLTLLRQMQLCTMCEVDEEMEYEFPCFNTVEMLEGLWDADDPRYKSPESCYGGITLHQMQGLTHLLASVFPHIQVDLRNDMESMTVCSGGNSNECDLYQWWHGSKMCWGQIECLLTLEGSSGHEYLQLKLRGPPSSGLACFYYHQRVLESVKTSVNRISPGLVLEKFALSSRQLKLHCDDPFSWSSASLCVKMLEHSGNNNNDFSNIFVTNEHTSNKESLLSLICYDDSSVGDVIVWCPNITMRDVDACLLTKLSQLLDPVHPLGAHWCMLAVALGVSQETIASMDSINDIWHTHKLLTTVNCDIGTLYEKLVRLGRSDASGILTCLAPLYFIANTSYYSNCEASAAYFPDPSPGIPAIVTPALTGSKIHTDV